MDAHFKIEGLVDEVADAIADRLKSLLPSEAKTEKKLPGDIMGLRPYALYSVAFVAERWGVDPETVRRKSDEDLPRANWQGGEIRYRGVDILRYEGVDVEAYLPENVEPLRSSTELEERPERKPAPQSERNDRRPYNQNLPEL